MAPRKKDADQRGDSLQMKGGPTLTGNACLEGHDSRR